MTPSSPQIRTFVVAPFLIASACLAICVPAWLAFNVAPAATFLNQAMALLGWAVFLA